MSRKTEATRKCGCGECRFLPPEYGACPQELSNKAVWLWSYAEPTEEPLPEELPGIFAPELVGSSVT